MVFSTVEFLFIFLPVAYGAFRLAGGGKPPLIVASVTYLALFGARGFASTALFCLLGYSVLKFYAARPASRAAFWTAISFNVAYLFIFKYFQDGVPCLKDFAPVGVSYFTFKAISAVVDAGYKKIDATSMGFLDYLFYLVYFPSLVAGPIARFRDLAPPAPSPAKGFFNDDLAEGFYLFMKGMVCKVLIADPAYGYFASRSSDFTAISAPNCALTIFAYSIFIYYDFLGYNFMALGASAMFGVKLPSNFNSPYLKRNIIEFWNSWHMTLSFWLRDYVFNPLGQALLRRKFFRERGLLTSTICYLFTFTLCGAWHGATAGFIAWGIYHGVMQSSYKIMQSLEKKAGLNQRAGYQDFFAKTGFAITFVFVSFGWIFFMFDSPAESLAFAGRLSAFSVPFDPKGLSAIARPLFLAIFLFYEDRRVNKNRFEDAAAKFAMAVIALNCILSLSNARAFLYGGF